MDFQSIYIATVDKTVIYTLTHTPEMQTQTHVFIPGNEKPRNERKAQTNLQRQN